jgi:hypothetical protein
MVSNFPRQYVTSAEVTVRPEQTRDGFGERVFDRFREAFCGLHGHDDLLQFEQDRMYLKCVSCGHESPGWTLNEARPRIVARAEHRPTALVATQLVGARKIA